MERGDHIVEGSQCRDVVWRRNRSWMLQRGRSPDYGERQGERGVHRGSHKENISPKPLTWKESREDFHEFFQLLGLKNWSFGGLWFGWFKALRALQCSCREGRQVTWGQRVQTVEYPRRTGKDSSTFLVCI